MKTISHKFFLRTILAACAFALITPAPAAEPRATPDEAKAMVKRAGEYLKKNGKDKAFAEFNNPKGAFIDRDLYIFAFMADGDGVELANGGNQKLVGKNVLEMKDADGQYLIKNILAVGKKKEGYGWVEYKWVNPVSKDIAHKRVYVENFDGVLLGCGAYD